MVGSSPVKVPTARQLLEAGVHFGHSSRRWHPRTAPYIFGKVRGQYIFDLEKTREQLSEACEFLYDVACGGGTILFVGLRKQSEWVVAEEAERAGAMFMTERWVGGLLTNFSEVIKNLSKLKRLEEGLAAGEFDYYTKKERLEIKRKISRLESIFRGVRDLDGLPQAVVLASVWKAGVALSEARLMGVPVVGIVDSNVNPDLVDYPIPANDDSLKSVGLLIKTLAQAAEAGWSVGGGVGMGASGLAVLGLSARLENAFSDAGVRSVEDLAKLPEAALLEIKGVGEKTAKKVMKIVDNWKSEKT